MRKLIFRMMLCPGDAVMLTCAIRDLHRAYPGEYLTDVRTACPAIFEHSPYIVPLRDDEAETIEMRYPIIKKSNNAAVHFVHGFRLFLEDFLKRPIPLYEFRGDIHLATKELVMPRQVEEPYWIIVSGGKNDFTAKLWDVSRWQQVVDHFQGRILFAQVGEWNHFHPNLRGVVDLRGKTDLRQLIRLVYHSDGVLCPVTSLMHLAAAVPVKSRPRPCVVVAGSREPPTWERYPEHRYLDNVGHSQLPCSFSGGCWKSRVVPLNDGMKDSEGKLFDESFCEFPELAETALIPRCLRLITSRMVIDAVDSYLP